MDYGFADMPADWWPDEILVQGKHQGIELAFAVISKEGRDTILQNIESLRLAIWHAKHSPDLGR